MWPRSPEELARPYMKGFVAFMKRENGEKVGPSSRLPVCVVLHFMGAFFILFVDLPI